MSTWRGTSSELAELGLVQRGELVPRLGRDLGEPLEVTERQLVAASRRAARGRRP